MSGGQSRISPVREVYARRRLRAIASRWDARAASWDRALQDPACCFNEDDAYRRFTGAVQRLIAKHRSFCARHGVIDAGCGTGLVLAEVSSAFAWGMGIDISSRMIRLARAKHVAKTKFIVGDCFDLASFCPKAGLVLSRGVLLSHYGRGQGQAMLHAARMALARGGFLVFDFLNEAARAKYRHAPENKTWFERAEVQAMAERAGFSAIRISGRPERRARLLIARA
ncbi:MAG: class I SAM-dependent DNA methyltransferase [Limisphaerales bacterium]